MFMGREMLSERDCHKEMQLSEEAYAKLPIASSKDRVALRAIFVHQGLKNTPSSILTTAGHFRMSPRLGNLAARALRAHRQRGEPEVSMEGRLGDILRAMCGTVGDLGELNSELNSDGYSDDEGGLEKLARKLAREALAKLCEHTLTAIETEYRNMREHVMQTAISHLTELDASCKNNPAGALARGA